MSHFPLPPYGLLDRGYREGINRNALAPSAWRPDGAMEERERSWVDWREDTIDLINKLLWPQWDFEACAWIKPDYDAMSSLTKRDFCLLHSLSDEGILYRRPETGLASSAIPTHFEYFQDEDTGLLGQRYSSYDVTLPFHQLESISKYKSVLDKKAGSGSVSLQFKMRFQRPRAYQVAALLGERHNYERAVTSTTPSMCSGHCLQGSILVAGTYESWLLEGFRPTVDQLDALAQFAADIGDRRVFAGVHFPSDNMASWIIALRLVKEVCTEVPAWRFLGQSIRKYSHIYRILKSSGFKEYEAALTEIDRLIDGLVDLV